MSYLDQITVGSTTYDLQDSGAQRVTLTGTSAPTTSTVGVVGQHYINTTATGHPYEYVCTAVSSGTYTWIPVDASEAPVTSVNSKTGAVVLDKTDIGLGNVDNVKQYSASNPPPYPVTSVNGSTGAVTVNVPAAATSAPLMDDSATVGTSTKYAREDHKHPSDTTKIDKSAELLTTNIFAPNSMRGPYISKIDNAFYAADKRWTVTATNVASGTVSNLFNGNYENSIFIENGNTSVITIDFSSESTGYFPGYPYGYIILSFYYVAGPASVTGRVYCNYSSQGVGWHDLTFTPLTDNTINQIIYRSDHQPYYNISKVEITIVGDTTNSYGKTQLSQIEMHLDRPDSSRNPFLSKYEPETLYYNLTVPNVILSDGTNVKTTLESIPTKTSDLTNDSGYITGMVELSYGSSTWDDFLTAYTAKKVVYCRASSNSNPASGSQTRKAFMAYVDNTENPTNVEFQYYRSVSTHSDSQQGDQVYVYKLTKSSGWSVTVREAYSKIATGTGISKSYSNGTITLSSTVSVPTASDATPENLGTAAAGSSANYSRADHVHAKPTYSKSDVGLGKVDNVKQYSASNPPPYPVTSVNGSTGAVTVAVPSAATATPSNLGTAAVGTSTKYAKEDHVHNYPDVVHIGSTAPSDSNIELWLDNSSGGSSVVSSVDGKSGVVTVLPSGGTTGQVLKKVSGTSYDVTWANESGSVTSVNGQTGDVTVSTIAVQDSAPSGGELVWIDTDEPGESITIPQIDDNNVSAADTWSSQKISSEISSASSSGGAMYFSNQTVNVATNAEIFRITNTAITTQTVLVECTFASPASITSDVTWTTYDGYIAFNGTCISATTADVTLSNVNSPSPQTPLAIANGGTGLSSVMSANVNVTFSGISATLSARRFGRVVELTGSIGNGNAFSSATGLDVIGTLPSGYIPMKDTYCTVAPRNTGAWASATYYNALIYINSDNGEIQVRGNANSLKSSMYIPLSITYICAD